MDRSSQQKRADLRTWCVGLLFGVPLVLGLCYVAYLFISVVFLGGSSACPQNQC